MASVLLVDDDADQLEIRQLVLETEAHAVAAVGNPDAALEAFDAIEPDIVVMDLRLPRTAEGIELIRQLRARSSSTPIIVLTGWPDDLKNNPIRPLITEVFAKPVQTARLLGLVDSLSNPH